MKTKCQEIMTVDPEYCEATCTVDKVAQLMKRKNVGAVPIVDLEDTRRLVGIITDRDLVLKVMAEGKDSAKVKAADVMTPNPVACKAGDDIDDALKVMEESQVRRIPIVNETGKLIGIISQADIALRLKDPKKIEEVVKEISKPAMVKS